MWGTRAFPSRLAASSRSGMFLRNPTVHVLVRALVARLVRPQKSMSICAKYRMSVPSVTEGGRLMSSIWKGPISSRSLTSPVRIADSMRVPNPVITSGVMG